MSGEGGFADSVVECSRLVVEGEAGGWGDRIRSEFLEVDWWGKYQVPTIAMLAVMLMPLVWVATSSYKLGWKHFRAVHIVISLVCWVTALVVQTVAILTLETRRASYILGSITAFSEFYVIWALLRGDRPLNTRFNIPLLGQFLVVASFGITSLLFFTAIIPSIPLTTTFAFYGATHGIMDVLLVLVTGFLSFNNPAWTAWRPIVLVRWVFAAAVTHLLASLLQSLNCALGPPLGHLLGVMPFNLVAFLCVARAIDVHREGSNSELFERAVSKLQTGDIIILQGSSISSEYVQVGLCTRYSHAGFIVRKGPEVADLYLAQCTANYQGIPDYDGRVVRDCVQLQPFAQWIQYSGYTFVAARRHSPALSADERDHVVKFFSTYNMHRYQKLDHKVVEVLVAALPDPEEMGLCPGVSHALSCAATCYGCTCMSGHGPRAERLFCSEFVARMLESLDKYRATKARQEQHLLSDADRSASSPTNVASEQQQQRLSEGGVSAVEKNAKREVDCECAPDAGVGGAAPNAPVLRRPKSAPLFDVLDVEDSIQLGAKLTRLEDIPIPSVMPWDEDPRFPAQLVESEIPEPTQFLWLSAASAEMAATVGSPNAITSDRPAEELRVEIAEIEHERALRQAGIDPDA